MNEDATARKMAAEAKDIAIANRMWRETHEKLCKEIREDTRGMFEEFRNCLQTLKDEIRDVVRDAERARNKLREVNSSMWLRVSWGAVGFLAATLAGLVLAIIQGWIGG